MKIKYECEVCGELFDSLRRCRVHEASHFSGAEKIKYELIHTQEEDICDYCDNSYYVYGCEQDCEYDDCGFRNNYKDFIPIEPFHNKRTHGGV